MALAEPHLPACSSSVTHDRARTPGISAYVMFAVSVIERALTSCCKGNPVRLISGCLMYWLLCTTPVRKSFRSCVSTTIRSTEVCCKCSDSESSIPVCLQQQRCRPAAFWPLGSRLRTPAVLGAAAPIAPRMQASPMGKTHRCLFRTDSLSVRV